MSSKIILSVMIILLINNLTPASQSSDFVTGMIKFTDQIGLNSLLLPLKIEPSVNRIKKAMKDIYTLSMAFNVLCFVFADGSAD